MLSLVLVVASVGCLVLLGEYLSRYEKLPPEICRKFVHITVGSFVAFWPLLLTWNQIFLLSAAFVIVVAASKYLKVFQAIHSVQRPTWGEIFFALSVGLLAALTQDGWMYMAALLHMSLADGLAAIVGTRFGTRSNYQVLGHAKSLIGSATFFVISVVIFVGYSIGTDTAMAPIVILGASIVATTLENVSTRGLDNITVPVWVAIVLSKLG
jgi:phytol kinase